MAYMAPTADLVRAIGRTQGQVEQAFQSGRGVTYEACDLHAMRAGFTKPTFFTHLTQTWVPAPPDVHARLQAGTASVAEIGAGCGWGVDCDGPGLPRRNPCAASTVTRHRSRPRAGMPPPASPTA